MFVSEVYMKAFRGEQLTEEEANSIRGDNLRKALIEFLVCEKLNNHFTDREYNTFRFTPGSEWKDIPILDLANDLFEVASDETVKPLSLEEMKEL